MDRRRFLTLTGAAAVAQTLPAHSQKMPAASLTLKARAMATKISPDFIGLGYEMSSPARPGLLSVDNIVYLQLVRQLGPRGTLRLGGIVGDHTLYEPDGTPRMDPTDTRLTRAAIVQLAAFLRATGWQAIWSVNFATASLQHAITELHDVASILGDRLLAVEIGNEVENYANGQKPHRPGGYSYEQYRAEYAAWRKAIVAAVPGLRFAAPDTAKSIEWVERMAADNAGTVQELTTHYYRTGQKQAQPEMLTVPDPELIDAVRRLQKASQTSGLPWRICEMNSFSGGGHPGLSDTLLGALWTLDVMMFLASSGCAGINLETGVNQLGFVSSYSPIQDDEHGRNWAGLPYYGMLACRAALQQGTHALALQIESANPKLTAYAIGSPDAHVHALVLTNRNTAEVAVTAPHGMETASMYAYRLAGDATSVTFGGAAVANDGTWRPVHPTAEKHSVYVVPAMSAVVLTTRPLQGVST